MNPAEDIERWLDDALPASDAAALRAAIDADADLRRAFVDQVDVHLRLGALLAPDDPGIWSRVALLLPRERPRGRLRVHDRLAAPDHREVLRARSRVTLQMVALAAVLVGAIALTLWATGPHDPAVAWMERADGLVSRTQAPIGVGEAIHIGESLTLAEDAQARLRYHDQSSLVIHGPAQLQIDDPDPGIRIRLQAGSLTIDAAPQRQHPLRVVTPQATISVVGTTFTVDAADDATLVRMRSGRTSVSAAHGEVLLGPGEAAIVYAGLPPERLAAELDEVLVHATTGRIHGDGWRIDGQGLRSVRGADCGGLAFDPEQARSWIDLMVPVEADVDYHVWVRGECLAATDDDPLRSDCVSILAPDGVFLHRRGDLAAYPSNRCPFTGFGLATGPRWIGGDDRGGDQDVPPVALRFARGGLQRLRLHAIEGPMRVDAILLSRDREQRPDAPLDRRNPLRGEEKRADP